jgi:DNA-binding CsgD family transcriptional regulator
VAADLIGVVEAAYQVDAPEAEWLAGVAEAGARLFDRGLGVAAYLYSFRADGLPAISALQCTSKFDPAWLPAWHRRLGGQLETVGNAPCGWQHWMQLSCANASQVPGLPPEMLDAMVEFGGACDTFAINGRDPSGFAVWVGAPLPHKHRLSAKQRGLYERVAAHLAAGYRLRRATNGAAGLERADAVLTGGGKLLHAKREAREAEARARLREAALHYDRARSVRGRRDSEAATAAWKGLVDARWTLLDRFDSDGKRFVIAARNDVALKTPAPLSERERQVLAFAALDHSNKEIAYELGLAPATVRVLMVRAARKLGASGRGDAIVSFRRLYRDET